MIMMIMTSLQHLDNDDDGNDNDGGGGHDDGNVSYDNDDDDDNEGGGLISILLPGVDVANSSIIQLLTKWSSVMIQVSH